MLAYVFDYNCLKIAKILISIAAISQVLFNQGQLSKKVPLVINHEESIKSYFSILLHYILFRMLLRLNSTELGSSD